MAQLLFPEKASGSLIQSGVPSGKIIGSKLIGQSFSAPGYFHGRPSAAGTGYDPMNSGPSNLGPTNRKLIEAVKANVAANGGSSNHPVPVDLVTSSGSGLDPDISEAAALYQVSGVASARKLDAKLVEQIVRQHTIEPQFGLLGERRINVLSLNLALDSLKP